MICKFDLFGSQSHVFWSYRLNFAKNTSLLRKHEWVHRSKRTEKGDDSYGLVFHSYQIGRERSWQIKRNCVKKRHPCKQSLKECCYFIEFSSKSVDNWFHFHFERIGSKVCMAILLFCGLDHIILRNLGELSAPEIYIMRSPTLDIELCLNGLIIASQHFKGIVCWNSRKFDALANEILLAVVELKLSVCYILQHFQNFQTELL